MKTQNYQFQLMYQGQEHKDFVYNETMLKLDCLMNWAVIDFIQDTPSALEQHEKYIVSNGENQNQICYFAHKSKGVQYIMPFENMIIFLIKANCFYIFINETWQKVKFDAPPIMEKKFIGVNGDLTLNVNEDYQYLYLNDNTTLDFSNINFTSFTIIIKQNYQNIFDIKWPTDILWKDKKIAKISQEVNAIDIFRFYKIPESSHFLAEIVTQNYQY